MLFTSEQLKRKWRPGLHNYARENIGIVAGIYELKSFFVVYIISLF